MKKIFAFILLWLWIINPVFSQVDEEFEEAQKALQKEINAFDAENQKEFDQYLEEIDKEFSDYLIEAWKEFQLFAGMKPDTTPKPKLLPRYSPQIQKVPSVQPPREIPVNPAPEKKPDYIQPLPDLPLMEKPEPEEEIEPPTAPSLSYNFFGLQVGYSPDPALNGTLPKEIHNYTIADFWDRINKTDYLSLLHQLADQRTRMNLNDWGYYLLVRRTAEKINPDPNYSRLLSWFLLTKAGYRVRVAYTENEICIMFPSTNDIYDLKYYTFGGMRFYADELTPSTIFTYEREFPGASKVLDLNLYSPLNMGNQYSGKTIKVGYKGKEYAIAVQYNPNSIQFYKDYPLCDLKIYFDASMSPGAKETILASLKEHTGRMTEPEAVDFILNFVQNGFAYKTDQEQFNGKEKFFFPEENFYYPFTDCDDRAVLFSWLIREILSLEVVGVVYPGHIATAIHFPYDVSGAFVMYNGKKYVIADPTYINAPVGLTMPDYANKEAQIIEPANEQSRDQQLLAIWEKAEAAGAAKGDNKQNIDTDADGNYFIAGYFTGEIVLGGNTLRTSEGIRDAFLAKYNSRGNPEWAIKGASEGNAIASNVVVDRDGNIYVGGTFEKSISYGGIMLMGEKPSNPFMARLNHDGKLVWLYQPDFTSSGAGDRICIMGVSAAGERLKTGWFPFDPNYDSYGLKFDDSGSIYYASLFATGVGTAGAPVLAAGASFNVVSVLKEETDKQLQNNCEKSIAGLFGAISLIKAGNVSISGQAVQEAFEKYNPGFKASAPKVYECLGRVKLMKNDQGIVTVQTQDSKPVILDKVKISNDSRLKVTILPNGDARMDILSGVRVGKAIIWFDLNYVRFNRINGNVLFDYDSDHSQVTMNMRKDLLF